MKRGFLYYGESTLSNLSREDINKNKDKKCPQERNQEFIML